jgi:hypothetical protein
VKNPYTIADDDQGLDITARKRDLPGQTATDNTNCQPAAKKRATKTPQEQQVAAKTAMELPIGAVTAHLRVNPPALSAPESTYRNASIFLGRLRDIFPDICPNHVKKLYGQQKHKLSRQLDMTDIIQQVTDELLENGTYPRVESRKRKEPEKQDAELTADQVAKLRANGTYDYYVYVRTFVLHEDRTVN